MSLIKEYQWDTANPLGYGNKMGDYKTARVVDFVKRFITAKSNNILDMGGGSGRIALPLVNEGFTHLTLIDLDQEAIKLCHKKGISNAICTCIDNFNQTDFDTVLAIELFNVTPMHEVLLQANRKLKEGGVLIFTGTNKASWRYRLHRKRKKTTKNLGEFTLGECKQFVVNNGFRILQIEGYNWMPFKVNSNSLLIPFCAFIERIFFLRLWLKQSPYLLFACVKEKSI